MKAKNIILVIIAILLLAFLFTVRYFFYEKLVVFKKDIEFYKVQSGVQFNKLKDAKLKELNNGDPQVLKLYSENFNDSNSILEKDTTFTFLYLSETIKYKSPSVDYIECLSKKCTVDVENEKIQKLIENKEVQLKSKYGDLFTLWYPKLKDSKLIKRNNTISGCEIFFKEITELIYDDKSWNDFDRFLAIYSSDKAVSDAANKYTLNQFEAQKSLIRNQLRSSVIGYFNDRLGERLSQIITTKSNQKTYESQTLGTINYSFDETNFDEEILKVIADDAFEEQWKSNSLTTGSMPYSNCYGSSNYCSGWGCSKIEVTSGGSDVLVTVKDASDEVLRHVYIRAGDSYTLNVDNGQYYVFFYSGTGWNPNKFMTKTKCGDLKGGFVSSESISKDNGVFLMNQIIRYELILQQDGNFSTSPSSKDEAF